MSNNYQHCANSIQIFKASIEQWMCAVNLSKSKFQYTTMFLLKNQQRSDLSKSKNAVHLKFSQENNSTLSIHNVLLLHRSLCICMHSIWALEVKWLIIVTNTFHSRSAQKYTVLALSVFSLATLCNRKLDHLNVLNVLCNEQLRSELQFDAMEKDLFFFVMKSFSTTPATDIACFLSFFLYVFFFF